MMNYRFITVFLLAIFPLVAKAYPITSYLEMVKVSNVGNTWKNVSVSNSYSNPVVACTYRLPSNANNEAAVRVQVGASIQVMIQRPLNTNAVTTSDVYCTISEEGSYTYPVKYEAHTVSSTKTNYAGNWNASEMVNVSSSPEKVQTYTKPVVIGQVMSYNNSNFSVFWNNRCGNRGTAPNNANICIGKHTGETVPTAPLTETLGYFIAEQGDYILASSYVKIMLGTNSIEGTGNSPPYSYSLPRTYSYATASQAAENGGNGGWAVLYGATPVSSQINLAIEEETVTGDTTRTHAKEQVAYWVMQPINKTYADLMINEVMYKQSDESNPITKEYIEFLVLSGGSLLNLLVSSQDTNSQNYRLPDVNVNTGDYVIFYSGTGTNSSSGGIHHIYSDGDVAVLANTADDIVLLKPSDTDATTLNGAGTHNVIPVDYMTYGTGGSIDAKPTSINGVTVSWNGSESGRLGGAAVGESVSLTQSGHDTDTSVCWEKTTSGDASSCPGFIITRDTDSSAYVNSLGKRNTGAPQISVSKTLLTIYDPYNGASNPKAIPGSVLEYIVKASNNGNLAADDNTIKISDFIPANTKLCVANAGYCKAPYFINGSPSSGLSLGGTTYSDNNGASYTYAASADAEGTDSNVTNLLASMNGSFQPKTGSTAPNFSLKFRVIVE